jgi:asparagine synthetase B (glutamine-hydrolysing)
VPEHLTGDFAFLVWDGRRRTLFGARDHFGVKPFYDAECGWVRMSNGVRVSALRSL